MVFDREQRVEGVREAINLRRQIQQVAIGRHPVGLSVLRFNDVVAPSVPTRASRDQKLCQEPAHDSVLRSVFAAEVELASTAPSAERLKSSVLSPRSSTVSA